MPPDATALAVLDTVPRVMSVIRREMRAARTTGLTIPQFRLLAFLARRAAPATLSEAAEHLGLALPAASKQVNALVERGLVARASAARDRRNLALTATAEGRAEHRRAREATRAALAKRLSRLSAAERAAIEAAMPALARAFAPVEVPA
jgi:DNA-binding MarR family transcriptional regulator